MATEESQNRTMWSKKAELTERPLDKVEYTPTKINELVSDIEWAQEPIDQDLYMTKVRETSLNKIVR